jgi:hypothetical protein
MGAQVLNVPPSTLYFYLTRNLKVVLRLGELHRHKMTNALNFIITTTNLY